MTELSFLIELVLDEELPLKHRKICAERIKEVEGKLAPQPVSYQAPSMQRIMSEAAAAEATTPHTAAASRALQARQQLINQAVSGKAEPGRTSPRKF